MNKFERFGLGLLLLVCGDILLRMLEKGTTDFMGVIMAAITMIYGLVIMARSAFDM